MNLIVDTQISSYENSFRKVQNRLRLRERTLEMLKEKRASR